MAHITRQMLRGRLEEQLAMLPLSPPTNGLPDYGHLDLLSIPGDEAFVTYAYRRILGREPDVGGMNHFVQSLKSHRQLVVDALLEALGNAQTETEQTPPGVTEPTDQTPESSSNGAGQTPPSVSEEIEQMLQSVPEEIEPMLQSSPEATRQTPPSAPDFVDLTELDRFEVRDEFVRQAYREILGREGDAAGAAHYRALLACGVPKVQVLAIIAASAEARARNIRFIWRGATLPEAGGLGFVTRLRLLFRRLSVRSRLEDAVSSLRTDLRADLHAEMETMRARYDAVGQGIQVLSTELQAAHTSIEKKSDTISAAVQEGLGSVIERMQEDRSSAFTFNKALFGVRERLDTIAAEIRLHEEAILLGQDRRSGEISQGINGLYLEVGGMVAGILEKLDAITTEIRIREEAIQLGQDQGRAETTQGLAGLRERAETIASMIRPPVLTGTDVLVLNVDNFVVAVPREDWSLAAYYSYWGTVDQGLTRCLAALLRPGMVVVDIGANVGLHSLHAGRAVGEHGKVYSFEPTPQTFGILCKNIDASGFRCIEPFPFAILDRRDHVRLHLREGNSPLNTLFGESGAGKSILVEAVTLDEALHGREQVDIVKIDAEGAEPFIMRGMTRIVTENPALIVLLEFAPEHLQRAGVRAAEFLQELRNTGFEIRRVDDLTGELSIATDEQLLGARSSNLHLQRLGIM